MTGAKKGNKPNTKGNKKATITEDINKKRDTSLKARDAKEIKKLNKAAREAGKKEETGGKIKKDTMELVNKK